MASRRRDDRCFKMRAQRTGHEGKDRRVGSMRFCAQQKWLVYKLGGDCIEIAGGKHFDLGSAVASKALAAQRAPHASADAIDDDGANECGCSVKEATRPPIEVCVIHPARVDDGPVEMIFAHLLERPAEAALLWGQLLVEVDAIPLFEVKADERTVADDRAVVVDVGKLALGSFAQKRQARFVECHWSWGLLLLWKNSFL